MDAVSFTFDHYYPRDVTDLHIHYIQFNLGWKLALVVKGFSPSSLLDTYTEERLPVIQDMLRRTRELLKLTLDPNRKESAMLRPEVRPHLHSLPPALSFARHLNRLLIPLSPGHETTGS